MFMLYLFAGYKAWLMVQSVCWKLIPSKDSTIFVVVLFFLFLVSINEFLRLTAMQCTPPSNVKHCMIICCENLQSKWIRTWSGIQWYEVRSDYARQICGIRSEISLSFEHFRSFIIKFSVLLCIFVYFRQCCGFISDKCYAQRALSRNHMYGRNQRARHVGKCWTSIGERVLLVNI